MINRRILRAKAIQYVYSYLISEKSNITLAEDFIAGQFKPDLMSMEPQDKNLLEKHKNHTLTVFHNISGKKDFNRTEFPTVCTQAAEKAIEFQKSKNRDDRNLAVNNLKNELKNVYQNYLITLYLLLKLYDVVEKETTSKFKFGALPVNFFELLRLIESVRKAGNNPEWNDAVLEMVYTIYKEELLRDQTTTDFIKSTERDLETEKSFLKKLFLDHLFKNGLYEVFMENLDINWVQNKAVVKDMVNKTLKSFDFETHPDHFLVKPSPNWDDDYQFSIDLLQNTLREMKDYEPLIESKLKNWELERVSTTDMALISTAITEMVHCPSIPVKVTINEFVEISKHFGDINNQSFINGLLDSVSKELEKQQKIVKTGRGLLDNK